MRAFTLSVADGKRQVAENSTYPVHTTIASASDLARAASFDHVGGVFQNDHRSKADFKETSVLLMDCDNDHTNDKGLWLTLQGLTVRGLPGVPLYIVYSRNHMRVKGDISPVRVFMSTFRYRRLSALMNG